MSTAAGVTITWATTCATVSATVASFPSADAWMVAPPFAIAVTTPVDETVATALSLLLKPIPTPGMTAPAASSATAVSCTVSPRLVSAAGAAGVSEIDATGGRVGPSAPQPARARSTIGQARRSGIHPPSAANHTGTAPEVEETFDRSRRASLDCASFHPPLEAVRAARGACCDQLPHSHARRAGAPDARDEPVRPEGDEDPAARQAGEGPEHRGARRAAQ